MIKLTFCLRRRPDLTVEEFQSYWLNTHGPLVQARAEALGVLRYVQGHTIDASGLHQSLQARNGGAPEPFDGTAELWFHSLADFVSASPDGQKAAQELLADEKNFIDLANSPMWLADEHVLVGE